MLIEEFGITGIQINSTLDNVPPVFNSTTIIQEFVDFELGGVVNNYLLFIYLFIYLFIIFILFYFIEILY